MGRVTDVSVLRGVTVTRDGRSVEVTGTRLRALLVLLALTPGQVRRAEYLADQLWNGEPPSANALQALISRLRRVLGPETLPSRPTGYLLDVDPAAVDLSRFERLAELATPAAAREALALAGLEPLAEFVDVPDLAGLARVIETECARLGALAARALESAVPVVPTAARGRLSVAHRLIGRDAVLSEIHDRLGRTRLLTLTGAGGSGKTSLAKAVASTHGAVHIAELAPVTAQAVDAEVFAAVGGRETVLTDRARRAETRDERARLVDALGDRAALLVLDNCEHVIDAAAGLAESILAACPRVTILATSREPLGVPGEQRLPVAPLEVPPTGSAMDRLAGYSAMQLLLERGRAVRPELGAQGEDGAALAEICRRLDGIPLALELAAARFNVLTPRQVAGRLDDRFRLLTTGARTALPRQQTLRAVVDWSWDLLDGAERDLLAVCGVFAGGAALADLEGVAGLDAVDVLDLIDRLVSKSLVLAEAVRTPDGGDGGMRYRLLETIREYALERLEERGELDAVRARHSRFFADLAFEADGELRQAGQVRWIARLDDAEDNLRTALDWAVEHGEAAVALRLCYGVSWYGMIRGKQFDRARTPDVLALAERSRLEPGPEYMRVLTFNALYSFERGAPPVEAAAQLREALELGRRIGWRDALASLVEVISALFTEPTQVEAAFRREAERLEARGEEWSLAAVRMFHAKVRVDESEVAERLTAQARAVFERLGDQWGIANCGQTQVMLHSQRGDHRGALAAIEAALPAARALGAISDEVVLLVMASNEYASLGEQDQSEAALDRAGEISEVHPEGRANLHLLTARSVRARLRGDLEAAEYWLDEMVKAAGNTFIGPVQALLRTEQAWLALARGEVEPAGRLADESFAHSIGFHYDRPDVAAAIEVKAAVELALGDPRRAAWLHGLFAAVRGRRLPLSATPDLARTAEAAVAAIGAQEYEACFAEGAAIEPGAVVETCKEVFGHEGEVGADWGAPGAAHGAGPRAEEASAPSPARGRVDQPAQM
ncbi:winged helix-turn-helix domain-containing protein [Actinospica durhamensis]|uniref:Winged helix-turn-helix domain-containing protein n=1 Tax=Actinospica durhamensis TaxID=1508375 RepID=A0A941EN40_9ACTN|nr:winged helix-turn-helix domain-containing protein [Actinospica durhamensis]MBR7833963.1 winged helix-turn-helix domain-containing protein [Actinospica durhamensis]